MAMSIYFCREDKLEALVSEGIILETARAGSVCPSEMAVYITPPVNLLEALIREGVIFEAA